ncbi:MAG: hypothetical protein ABL900_08760 [Burkholderiaceae bacterium]
MSETDPDGQAGKPGGSASGGHAYKALNQRIDAMSESFDVARECGHGPHSRTMSY